MKKTITLLLYLLPFFCVCQEISLGDYMKILQLKSFPKIKSELLSKGWKEEEQIKKQETITNVWTKGNDRVYIYTKDDKAAGGDLEIVDRGEFINLKKTILPLGFIHLESGLENQVEKTFLNNPTEKMDLVLMVSSVRIGREDTDVYNFSFSFSDPVDGLRRKQTMEGLVEYTVSAGKENGWYISYYNNGNIRYKTYYKDGVEKGQRKEYYQDGSLKGTKMVDGGVVSGSIITYHNNGKKETEAMYKNGKADGLWKVYYDTGEKKSEIPYSNDKINGVVKEFYKNGKLETIYNYVDGQMQGAAIWYFENGDKDIETNYKDGKQHGFRNLYYQDGGLKSSSLYNMDVLDGVSTSFFPDGKPLTETMYRNGEKINMKRYGPDGKLASVIHYRENIEEEYTPDNHLIRLLEKKTDQVEETLYKDGKIAEKFITKPNVFINDVYAYYKSGNLAKILRSIDIKGKKTTYVNIFISSNSRRLLYPDGTENYLNLKDDNPFTGTFEYLDEDKNIREIRTIENGVLKNVKHK